MTTVYPYRLVLTSTSADLERLKLENKKVRKRTHQKSIWVSDIMLQKYKFSIFRERHNRVRKSLGVKFGEFSFIHSFSHTIYGNASLIFSLL